MNLNPKFLIYHDLIGLHASAKPKKKKIFLDIGVVIDDSKNILITEKNNKIKKYIKKDHIFRFKFSNENNNMLEVVGTKIVGRPENRLRNIRKRKWLK
ncbi:MAG: ribonuclease P protein subunit [Promethearchaeota archaeon]